MNYKQKRIFLFIITIFAFNCKQPQDISIVPMTMFNYIDTIRNNEKVTINKIDYFLVSNYSDNKQAQDLIDSFAHRNKDANINSYYSYQMLFYKESKKTNIKNLSTNPRDLYRYSQDHDLIYRYSWSSGKFLIRFKLKNGEIIEPKHNIKIERIPE